MKRHRFNIFSLTAGLIFLLLAAWIAFPSPDFWPGLVRLALPVALILIGLALMSPLVKTWRRKRRTDENGVSEQ